MSRIPSELTRRTMLGAPLGAAVLLGLPSRLMAHQTVGPAFESFPSQNRSLVYDTVLYAHSDIDKVRALVEPVADAPEAARTGPQLDRRRAPARPALPGECESRPSPRLES